MASSTTELIKEKLDIVAFLRGYLPLQQAGKNLKALCPFHKEKTPSFMVSPERQSWHCFGCNTGGDAFGFLMRYENIEFGEALRILAEKAGVELRRLNPAEYRLTGLLYELNEAAKEFFKNELGSSAPAKQYLAGRGLKKETIEEFELGWAPNEFEALSLHLLHRGYAPNDLMQAGLALKNDRGLLTDRFRGRIMFPIHNHLGKVVGFSGRILPEFDAGEVGSASGASAKVAKYVNSPETPVFVKSRILYGFWKSKNFIREAGAAFLVEGQMDFLLSWQAGMKSAVASSGTALTADHLRVLRRLTDRILLSFDNDEAGREAGERAIDLAEAGDCEVKVVTLGKFKDPAEAAEKDPSYLTKALAAARPAMEFYFDRYLPEGKLDPAKREHLTNLRAVLRKIRNVASPVEQNFWLTKLSERTGIGESILAAEAERAADGAARTREEEAPEGDEAWTKGISRRALIGQRLLSHAFAQGDASLLEDVAGYLDGETRALHELLLRGERRSADARLDALLDLIILRSEVLSPEEEKELKYQLLREYVKERREELARAIRSAEEAGDEKKLASALEEIDRLSSVVSE